ncbi:hypothetical protein COU19_00140 [Candidatus Kaiserbacteria bacterium CG10_big_fil_rev_8_21_14_0_10_56_12]|uniref:CARDB domain-containing protein n=1 Tax=Candidatus Kaiserbacteria bacterium CG10_big_fil_rev_8_21_14_0_10_56_12 TaxID=1974611 RepID=A0A2H0UAR0_9BACT|nr:MAG: hypothetical protein COU19_00140 [Candidatus Kaiserbacteria bacterium CG10_big_fil_rev_8_21_14_0_10_56_12]
MTPEKMHAYRQTATNTLAVVGFVALIGLGIWGAVYSARFVPAAVEPAAVYLGSLFNHEPDADVAVVPTATSTVITFGTPVATTTTPVATTTPATTATPQRPAGTPVTTIVRVPVTTPAPHGLADLTVIAGMVGYLTSDSTDSFVASSTAPSDARPAVKFTVKNIGTNWSGTWRFSATIPTRTSYTYHSSSQPSIGPGDSIDYVLGFDQSTSELQQTLEIQVNDDKLVPESDTSNNTVEFKINVL